MQMRFYCDLCQQFPLAISHYGRQEREYCDITKSVDTSVHNKYEIWLRVGYDIDLGQVDYIHRQNLFDFMLFSVHVHWYKHSLAVNKSVVYPTKFNSMFGQLDLTQMFAPYM